MINDLLKRGLTFVFRSLTKIFGSGQPRFIFIMGHMRSGSSLLSHLLMSNPEILGLGESNAIYTKEENLWRLALKCRLKSKRVSGSAQYLDQINHSGKTPDTKLLLEQNVKIILLFRNPNNAASSILKLSEEFYGKSWTIEMAEQYIIERYESLILLSQQFPKERFLWVQYEDLTNKSEETLHKITHFLALQTPLSVNYNKFGFTGKHGDPSANILSGKIRPTKSGNPTSQVSEQCMETYRKCQEASEKGK